MAAISATGLVAAAILLMYPSPSAETAQAAVVTNGASSAPLGQTAWLRSQLAASRGQMAALRGQLDRATRIIGFSGRFSVSADLAARIYDAAVAESIDPELAFRLVNVESDFNPRAVSPAGALGLTQLMPATARFYDNRLRDDQLFDPDLNLHIGFRYLHSLVEQYHGAVGTALLVYNRGEVAVESARARGVNPTNGYEKLLMKGYTGRGITDID